MNMVFMLVGTGLSILLLIMMLFCWRESVVLRFFMTLNREIDKDIQTIRPMIERARRLLEEGKTKITKQLIDKIKQQQDLIDKAQHDLNQLMSLKIIIHYWKSLKSLIAFSPALMYYQKKRKNENIKM